MYSERLLTGIHEELGIEKDVAKLTIINRHGLSNTKSLVWYTQLWNQKQLRTYGKSRSDGAIVKSVGEVIGPIVNRRSPKRLPSTPIHDGWEGKNTRF